MKNKVMTFLDNDKNKIIMIIVAVLVLFLLFYLINNKGIGKNGANKKLDFGYIGDGIKSHMLYNIYDKTNQLSFKLNGKDYNVEIEKVSDREVNLKINKEIMFNRQNETSCSIDKIFLLGDLLGIVTKEGSDTLGTSLTFIDMLGSDIMKVKYLDQGNLKLRMVYANDDITLNGDSIFIRLTANSSGNQLLVSSFEDGQEYSLTSDLPLSADEKNRYNISDNTVIGGTYKLTYKGNDQFSDLELQDSVTYGQIIAR